MVGRWVSFWDSLFSGAMLNFGGVKSPNYFLAFDKVPLFPWSYPPGGWGRRCPDPGHGHWKKKTEGLRKVEVDGSQLRNERCLFVCRWKFLVKFRCWNIYWFWSVYLRNQLVQHVIAQGFYARAHDEVLYTPALDFRPRQLMLPILTTCRPRPWLSFSWFLHHFELDIVTHVKMLQ